jgi:hypothetical protein
MGIYESIVDQSFEVQSNACFQKLCSEMENRFDGLPDFHTSVHLEMRKIETIQKNVEGKLELEKTLVRRFDKHLRKDVYRLMSIINEQKGNKAVKLLEINVRICPVNWSDFIKNEEFKIQALKKPISFLGARLCTPIILMAASVSSDDKYISLATGVKGVSNYKSSIFIDKIEGGRLAIRAGLKAEILPQHLDHKLKPLLTPLTLTISDQEVINRYLSQYLVPEKETIVKKLYNHVEQLYQDAVNT